MNKKELIKRWIAGRNELRSGNRKTAQGIERKLCELSNTLEPLDIRLCQFAFKAACNLSMHRLLRA